MYLDKIIKCETTKNPVLQPMHSLHGKGKGKFHPITGQEDADGEYRYSSTLSLTSALDGRWVVNATSQSLYPRERTGTDCIGGWVGPRAGLEGCGKFRPYRDSNPVPSSP
jgi:hypothetical protein